MDKTRNNNVSVINAIMIDDKKKMVEHKTIDPKTGIETIIYQHPKIKKWREELKTNPHAKVDDTILDTNNMIK